MATDYFGVLGLSRGASDSDIKRAYRRLARDLHPDVNPDPEAKERFQEVTRAYEALTDPEKGRIVDLGGDPFDNASAGAGGFGGAGFGGLGDIMDAFFGGAATRGPRSRTRAGRDALIPIELELDETVFGTTKDITVDTAVLCTVCTGAGTAPGTHPTACTTCGGRGEVQSVQRGFLGQVVSSRVCPTCAGVGQVIPDPGVRRRRAGPVAAHAAGEGARRRRGRHAHPPDRAGRGRSGRRPGRGPVRRDPRAPARRVHPRRGGPALPGHPADDLGSPGD